jgi:hypothetical protein
MLSLCFGALAGSGQTKEEVSVLPAETAEPPAVSPAECSAALLVASDAIRGSASYVRPKQEINAIAKSRFGSQLPLVLKGA